MIWICNIRSICNQWWNIHVSIVLWYYLHYYCLFFHMSGNGLIHVSYIHTVWNSIVYRKGTGLDLNAGILFGQGAWIFPSLTSVSCKMRLILLTSSVVLRLKWSKLYHVKNIKRSPLDSESQEGRHHVLLYRVFMSLHWKSRWITKSVR